MSSYLACFSFSSLTTFSGAFAKKPWLDNLPFTLATSPSSFFFSFVSLSNSALKSTRSSNGIKISTPLITADITSSGTPDLSVTNWMSVILAKSLIYLSPAWMDSIFSPSAKITAVSFLLGAASASALMFLMARIASIASSSLSSSAAKCLFSLYSGHCALIKKHSGLFSLSHTECGKKDQISSVMNGMNGCSISSMFFSTITRTNLTTFLSSSSSPHNLFLTSSIYQSQYSFQISSYTLWPASARSYLSNAFVTYSAASLTLLIIHLSSSLSAKFSKFVVSPQAIPQQSLQHFAISLKLPSSSCRFMITNLDAFHNLFAKFLADSSLSSLNLMSLPGVIPVVSMNLRASAPYWSMISSGSMPLPKDLDILRPCASLTKPCTYTWWNGHSSIASKPENTILTTQKKMMS